jgi:transglutaminase 1
MSHPSDRDEYLFNEVGKLYAGSHNNIQGRPWVYGHFRDTVLPAVCHIMDKSSRIRDADRGDPVKVARAISAIVNSINDNGILIGRWDGNYDDGTKPFDWTGSVPILEEYIETGKPVKYGQCWVFAGVAATGKSYMLFPLPVSGT